MADVGKRYQLTREQVDAVGRAMRDEGLGYYRAASIQWGVTERTAARWLRRGERDIEEGLDTVKAHLKRVVVESQAEVSAAAERTQYQAIREGDVRAAQWYLEHRHPDEYGRQILSRIQVEGEVESTLDQVKPHMPQQSYLDLLRAIAIVQGVDVDDEGDVGVGVEADDELAAG